MFKRSTYLVLGMSILLLTITSPNAQSEDPLLTIYTYDSLLIDPGYDFIGNFSEHANIDPERIELVYLSDAGEIISRATLEKENPQADVLIGIDNALIHQAREQNILKPYQSSQLSNLRDGLVDNLAPDNLLTPYDYGVISLWHDDTRFSGFEGEFTLQTLLDDEFQKQLIIQDPRLSSPGLGFLLWSIAELGYSDSGELSSDWNEFWLDLNDNTLLTNSWGDAINLFYTPEVNRSIMVSYTSSPAYGACLYEDYTTSATLTNTNEQEKGWLQIEGLGLVNGATNEALAKQFIDWFVSEELQNQIYQNQWIYPAREGISIPECYLDSAISPEEITSYNDQIPTEDLELYVDDWIEEWENVWNQENSESNQTDEALLFAPWYIWTPMLLVMLGRSNRRKND